VDVYEDGCGKCGRAGVWMRMKMDAVSVGVQVCGCVCVDVYEDGCGRCGRAGVWMCVDVYEDGCGKRCVDVYVWMCMKVDVVSVGVQVCGCVCGCV